MDYYVSALFFLKYGLFEIPSDFDTGLGNVEDDDGGDSDLEAELAALASGGGPRPKRKGNKTLISQGEIDAMAAENMKDIPSDDDISVDENDPELLGELSELTGKTKIISQNNLCLSRFLPKIW